MNISFANEIPKCYMLDDQSILKDVNLNLSLKTASINNNFNHDKQLQKSFYINQNNTNYSNNYNSNSSKNTNKNILRDSTNNLKIYRNDTEFYSSLISRNANSTFTPNNFNNLHNCSSNYTNTICTNTYQNAFRNIPSIQRISSITASEISMDENRISSFKDKNKELENPFIKDMLSKTNFVNERITEYKISDEMIYYLDKEAYNLKKINLRSLFNIDIPYRNIPNVFNNLNNNNKNLIEINNNIKLKRDNFINDVFYTNKDIYKIREILTKKTNFKSLELPDEETLNNGLMDYKQRESGKISFFDQKLEEYFMIYENDYDYKRKYLYYVTNPIKFNLDFKNINERILFYRKVINDGDSFFISFIFQYLERLILNKDINKLKIISYEFITKIPQNMQSQKELNSEINEPVLIIDKIILNIKRKDIAKALKILVSSFANNYNFILSLIKIIKLKIADFIIINARNLSTEEFRNNGLINSKYYNCSTNLFYYHEYIEEKILVIKSEPDLFILHLIPQIFNISLYIYANESFGNCQKVFKIPSKNYANSLEPCHILFSNYSYHILYNENYYNLYANHLFSDGVSSENIMNPYNYIPELNKRDSNSEINLAIKEYKTETVNVLGKRICKECEKESIFINLCYIAPQCDLCLNCLTNGIVNVFKKRLKNLFKEEFKNLEYYLRNIPIIVIKCHKEYIPNNNISNKSNEEISKIMDNDNSSEMEDKKYIFINQPEFKYIFGIKANVLSELRSFLQICCYNCLEFLENPSDFVTLECGCKICKKCLVDTIETETNHKIILNHIEKKRLRQIKGDKILCPCKNYFTIDKYFNDLFTSQEIENYRIKAEERLFELSKNVCFHCGEEKNIKFSKDDITSISNSKSNKASTNHSNNNISSNNNYIDDWIHVNICDNKKAKMMTHNICKSCIEEIKNSCMRKVIYMQFSSIPSVIYVGCKLCDQNHPIEYSLISKFTSKNNDCCVIN